MSHPRSVSELVYYLARHPNLTVQSFSKTNGYRFIAFDGVRLSFAIPNSSTTVSIPTTVGDMHFYQDRFERRIFNRTEKYWYTEMAKPSTLEGEWDEIFGVTRLFVKPG